MKVALSASYWKRPSVAKVLDDCDLIYTTQAHNFEALVSRFGADKVRIIPDATPALLEFLKSRHEGAEFIEFSDLTRILDPREA